MDPGAYLKSWGQGLMDEGRAMTLGVSKTIRVGLWWIRVELNSWGGAVLDWAWLSCWRQSYIQGCGYAGKDAFGGGPVFWGWGYTWK